MQTVRMNKLAMSNHSKRALKRATNGMHGNKNLQVDCRRTRLKKSKA